MSIPIATSHRGSLQGLSFDLASLQAAFRDGILRPTKLVREIYRRQRSLDATGRARGVWITLMDEEEAIAQAQAIEARGAGASRQLPLYGIPFAVKDNIDCEGLATTAACPEFAYKASADAAVVARLKAAGAILVGKTNLDQFATGLVGVRSPYGICANPFDPRYIPGGSSSGSAVSVALGLVSFALGTDTAGSGRVPAAFNNVVGLKPTRGRVSTRGVVPACRSLDCVSIFALTCADAWRVFRVAEGFDPADPFSRERPQESGPAACPAPFRFGVPQPDQQEFFGDEGYRRLFDRALQRLVALGGIAVEIDFAPLREAAELLYGGPWVAERLAALGPFYAVHSGALHPVLKAILDQAGRFNAMDVFRAFYRLEEIRRIVAAMWSTIDVLVTPTAPTIYKIEDVMAEPVLTNNKLGTYTNFVNLLDLAAVAVPAGFRDDGLPFGVTLISPAWRDEALCALGSRLHRATDVPLGATGHTLSVAAEKR